MNGTVPPDSPAPSAPPSHGAGWKDATSQPPALSAQTPAAQTPAAQAPSVQAPAALSTPAEKPTPRQKLVSWLWRILYAVALCFCLLFFLDHSSGRDVWGKLAVGGILLLGATSLVLVLSPPPWATLARLTAARRLAMHLFTMFLVASAMLRATEAYTIDRAWTVQTGLQQCFREYGMYPLSLTELTELTSMPIPLTASLRHPGQFRYQRFGKNGEHYVLRFDAAMFGICSRSDLAGDTGWRCTTDGDLPLSPPDTGVQS